MKTKILTLLVSLAAAPIAAAQNPPQTLFSQPVNQNYVSALDVFSGGEIAWEPFPGGFGRSFLSPRSPGAPLIVRSGETEPATLSQIQEDLTVMSLLLQNAVPREDNGDRKQQAMGITLSDDGPGRRLQNIYLEGFGALFTLNVRFPLVPIPESPEPDSKAADSAWEKARQEVYGGRDPSRWPYRKSPAPSVPYDAQQVEQLKKGILESLKNAANIRNIKPDEFIAVAIMGSPGARRVERNVEERRSGNERPEDRRRTVTAFAIAGPGAPTRDSTMSIRVKKADVDAFSKGRLTFAEFQKKAAISVY